MEHPELRLTKRCELGHLPDPQIVVEAPRQLPRLGVGDLPHARHDRMRLGDLEGLLEAQHPLAASSAAQRGRCVREAASQLRTAGRQGNNTLATIKSLLIAAWSTGNPAVVATSS